MNLIEDGIIELDTERGKMFGFTSDKFLQGISWLWKKDREIIISCIMSRERGKGHFKGLVDKIESLGYTVSVPTPLSQMQAILEHWGFVDYAEFDELFMDTVHIWRRKKHEK